VKRILFACPDNGGRSEMAAAFFNHLADPGLARALSAITQPGGPIHPALLEAMLEVGVDLPQAPPRRLTSPLATTADYLVTMGCGDDCPLFPGVKVHDWPVADPNELPCTRVREIRDDVRRRVEAMLASHCWMRSAPAARDRRG
jgi:arsenate reductase (thioredoxin)